jgi:glutamate dehydrogenase
VVERLPELLKGSDLAQLLAKQRELVEAGVPEALAARVGAVGAAYSALDIVEVARDSRRAPAEVAGCYFDLADRLGINTLRDRITALPRTDRWQSMARSAVREELYAEQAALTFDVLAAAPAESDPDARFESWVRKNRAAYERAAGVLDEIAKADTFDLAILSVALRSMRTLLRTAALA